MTLTKFYTTRQAYSIINLVNSIIYQFGYFIPLFTVKVDISINLHELPATINSSCIIFQKSSIFFADLALKPLITSRPPYKITVKTKTYAREKQGKKK